MLIAPCSTSKVSCECLLTPMLGTVMVPQLVLQITMWQGPKGKMALMRIACPSPKRWGYVASGYCFLYSDRQSDWLRYSAGLKHWVYYPGAGLPRAGGSMPRFSLEGKGQPPTPLSPSIPLSPPLLHPRPLGIWKILWFPCSFLQLSFSWNFWQFFGKLSPLPHSIFLSGDT